MIVAAVIFNSRRWQWSLGACVRFANFFCAIALAICLSVWLPIVVIATNFAGTDVIAGRCHERRLIVLLAVVGAANFVAALIIPALFAATALGGRDVVTAFVVAIATWVIAGREDVVPGIGGRNRASFAVRVSEIRENLLRLHLTLAQSGEVVGDGFFLVETDLAGIGPDEAFVEYAAGKLVKVFVFQGAEHARADFCGVRDGIQRESALLALLAKFFPERSQGRLPRA
jgi:hypothetical protein